MREVLTELDVVYELRSCGKGSCRRGELSDITGGSTQCPYLIDPNTGVAMAESGDIVGEWERERSEEAKRSEGETFSPPPLIRIIEIAVRALLTYT